MGAAENSIREKSHGSKARKATMGRAQHAVDFIPTRFLLPGLSVEVNLTYPKMLMMDSKSQQLHCHHGWRIEKHPLLLWLNLT